MHPLAERLAECLVGGERLVVSGIAGDDEHVEVREPAAHVLENEIEAWPRHDVVHGSVGIGEEMAVGQLDDRVLRASGHERGPVVTGVRRRSAPGRTSNRAGVVPGCSPSSSTGRGSSVSTVTTRPRSASALGCGRWVPR